MKEGKFCAKIKDQKEAWRGIEKGIEEEKR